MNHDALSELLKTPLEPPLDGKQQSPPKSQVDTLADFDWGAAGVDALAGAWESLKADGVPPRRVADACASDAERREFLEGSRLLNLWGGRRSLKPQQLVLADSLCSGHGSAGVLMPRRSSKTTTLNAFGLGRVACREEYRAAILTLTTGKAGISRFTKDVAPQFARHERAYAKAGKPVPWKVYRGKGYERVEFVEPGSMMVWASSVDDLRGEYFDLVILDESGEPEPEKVVDVKDAALPTMDTSDDPLLVVAGTAGRFRDGNLLWEYVQRLAEGDAGGVLYGFADDVSAAEVDRSDLANWPHVAELLEGSHPGVGTLTTLDRLHESWRGLTPEAFLREYGSLFGVAGSVSKAVSPSKWAAAAVSRTPQPPARFALAVSTHVDQRAAAIVAAWRVDGRAHLLLLAHGIGTAWVAPKLIELWNKYGQPIWHDSSGPTRAETLDRRLVDARVKLTAVKANQVTAAAALLVRDIDNANLTHYGQAELTEAALSVVKRQRYSGWSLAPADGFDGDATAVEAASFALLAFDGMPAARKTYRPS